MKEKGIQNRNESCLMNKIPKIVVVDEDGGHLFNQKHERPSTSSLVLNKSLLSEKQILNQRRFLASPISPTRRQTVSPSPGQQFCRQSVSPSQSGLQSFSPSSSSEQQSRRQSVSPSPARQSSSRHSVSHSVSPSSIQQNRLQSVSTLPALQSRRHSVSLPNEQNQRNAKSQKSTFSKYSNVDSFSFVERSVKSASTDRKRLNGPSYIRGRSNSTTSTSSVRSRSTCSVKSVKCQESSEINLSPESILRSKSSNDIASVFDSGFSLDFTETISSIRRVNSYESVIK
ncbi:unnamed protein product [Mytilus coruscus]|uniref:Uncharacterized protein n=1 Tax=Mytilus coruscus TaxID=42192 RepID=A0A6J8DJJ8_MYTCO|nr:unnamed protein product [Mytilus coruscus]